MTWFQTIDPGSTFVVARREDVDLLGAVSSGRVSVALTDRSRLPALPRRA